MPLPTYDKSKRKQFYGYEMLPKNAYVLKILNAKQEKNKNNSGSHLTISFDVAEGEYKDFYFRQYKNDNREDKKWPNDANHYLTIPTENSEGFIWDNWNTFFADLEDSNNGYVFSGNPADLKNKLIGGKMYIEQSASKGTVYDHCRLKWTCVADDVRQGKAGQMPKDKLLSQDDGSAFDAPNSDDDFVNVPDGIDDELPFI